MAEAFAFRLSFLLLIFPILLIHDLCLIGALDESLVGWWKMKDSPRNLRVLVDSSSNGANGTISGATSWDESNGALIFNGAGKVSFGTKPSLSGKTSFTISAWVKVPASPVDGIQFIFQQRDVNAYNGEFMLYLRDANPFFQVFGDNDYQFEFAALVALNDSKWHQVVVVRNNTDGYIYIDGKPCAFARGNVKNLDGRIPASMGWDLANKCCFFVGSLINVRLYKRALSSDEIRYVSTWPEALIAWWKMDEKSGLIVKDSSGNGAHGNIRGSTSWEQNGGLTFRGAGKVSFGTKASLNGKTSFSIHACVKFPENATSEAVIIQQRGPSGFNGEYRLSLIKGKLVFWIYGDGNTQFTLSSPATINDDQWHYIIVGRDGGDGFIYVDGTRSISINGTTARNLDKTIPVFIGWDARDNISFLRGTLKEVKVYDQFLLLPNQNTLCR